MSGQVNFWERFRATLLPTVNQTLGALGLSAALLALAQSQSLMHRLGISSAAITTSQIQFHDRFDVILRSSIASHIALVTFWATIGLIAYLICWGAYNILIEARNEVTLATEYTNRGHWRGPYETLALKAAAATGLALIIGSLWFGLSFWMALSGRVISHPDPSSVTGAVIAVVGLALQLYLLLAFVQFTFTPWYRMQTFTDLA
ncbi:MAG: hypothetical protein JWN01_140 [Patescibacteria group bacterium]|nr:hypothetical protein [Patescibacteria group bacterium]